MGFAGAVKSGLRKTLDFKSRASRSEYWWFALFVLLFNIAAALLGIPALFMDAGIAGTILSIAGNLLILAMMVPHLAVLVRRLHDADQSGWLVVALLILAVGQPFVQRIYILGPVWLVALICGFLAQFFFLVSKGSEGDNRFGPPPASTIAALALE